MAGEHDVFLSYSRSDGSELASRLEEALSARGLSTWRDRRSIDPYQDFSAEIEKGIRASAFVVVCVTPSIDADPDSFVRREILYAQQLEKPIIPAVFPGSLLPTLINHLTWIPFFTGSRPSQRLDFESGLARLLERLAERPVAAAGPAVSPDPFRPYLTELYGEIVELLEKTVLSLIPVEAADAPGVVAGSPDRSPHALPLAFWERSDASSPEPPARAPRRFGNLREAFGAHRGRLLLLGEPGAGKTTTLLAFARDAVARRLEDPAMPLPLVAPVATWDAVRHPDLVEWLSGIITALSEGQIHRTLSEGGALLLLDGLDELGRSLEDPETGELLDPRQEFVPLIPEDNQVLVTSRVREYEEMAVKLPLSGAVALKPLDDRRLADYLREQPDLLAAVQADDQLREMARTPLLLSLFAFAYANLGGEARRLRDLASSPSELRFTILRAYVERRWEHEVRRWKTAGRSPLSVDLAEIYEVFGAVAERTLISRWGRVSGVRLTEELFDDLVGRGRARQLIDLGCQLHLLLSEGEDRWRFIHQLIRDHFAVGALLKTLDHPDPELREVAVGVLAEVGDSRAVGGLLRVVHEDAEEEVRAEAASALGALGDPRARDPLYEALRREPGTLRPALVVALGELSDRRVEDDLIELAAEPFDPTPYGSRRRDDYTDPRTVAGRAARVLERFGTPAAQAAVEEYQRRENEVTSEEWREWSEDHAEHEGYYE